MKTCILSANCQGEFLKYFLNRHPDFSREWEIKYYVNFHKTPIPEGEIENCDLLLHQGLADNWEELSANSLLSRLPKKAKAFCIPNLANFHLWPTAVTPPNAYDLWFDSYVEDLISRKLSYKNVVYIAMRADFSKIFDLSNLMTSSLHREYAKDYFGRTEIFKFIGQNWKEKELFTTPIHPANSLIFLVLNIILKELGFLSLKIQGKITGITCDNEFFLPVHPFYIKHYDIKYLTEETQYPVFGNNLTYKEYLMAYVDARQNEIPLLQYFTDLRK